MSIKAILLYRNLLLSPKMKIKIKDFINILINHQQILMPLNILNMFPIITISFIAYYY